MREDLISIIVPVYNVEKYLERCLNSVINQTYKKLEIIVVNDGSTDGSGRLCDKLKNKDKRIQVYHKQNGGLSDARNYGIKKSKGTFLFFLDSDDFIKEDTIEYLYFNCISNNADIATIYHQPFTKIEEIKENQEDIYEKTLSNIEALENLLYIKNCSNSSWGKLFKSELFNNISFPNGKICEDLATTYLLFSHAKKIFISSYKKYYYFYRENSITNSSFIKNRMDGLYFAFEQTQYICANFPTLKKAAINREFREAFYIYKVLPNNYKNYYKEYKLVIKTIKNNRKVILMDRQGSLKLKQFALLSYFGNLIYIIYHFNGGKNENK